MAYSAVLLKEQVKVLQAANKASVQRKRKQKKRIAYGGSLTVQEGEEIFEDTAIQVQIQQEVGSRIVRPCSLEGK